MAAGPPQGIKLVSIPHGDLGQGIDALSSQESIPEGYSEVAINADAAPEGYIGKRVGYQGVLGYLPLRVTELKYAADGHIPFVFDQSVNLAAVPAGPIVAFGRTSGANTLAFGAQGDFPVGQQELAASPPGPPDAVHYYPSWGASPYTAVHAGSNTIDASLSDQGITTAYTWVGVAVPTALPSLSNRQ